MQKHNFFYTSKVWAKIILPEKVRKLDESNSGQNSVKGPQDPNSAKKCHQKARNRDLTHFCIKTA